MGLQDAGKKGDIYTKFLPEVLKVIVTEEIVRCVRTITKAIRNV
jgi:hypothetical protein